MIAGSREELERIRDKKTVQNWASAGDDEPVVPAAALADLLLDRWLGKQPKTREEPEELRRTVSLVRELYLRTRGTGPAWGALRYNLQRDLEALPRVGERYRPIANTGGSPPG